MYLRTRSTNKYLERQVKEDAREVGGITAEAITRGSVQREDKLTGLMQKPRELNTPTDHDMFYWTNNRVPMINGKYIEIRSNFNTEVKKVYLGEFHIIPWC